MAQHTVGSPIFGEFDDGAGEIAVMLFEFGFEAGEESEGVGRGAGESGDNFSVIETAKFLGGGLENLRALGDLAVTGHDDFGVTAHT